MRKNALATTKKLNLMGAHTGKILIMITSPSVNAAISAKRNAPMKSK